MSHPVLDSHPYLRHLPGADVFGPPLLAIGSAIVSHVAHVNWIGVLGTCISGGWLALGVARFALEVQDRRERRRATAPPTYPTARPDGWAAMHAEFGRKGST